MKYILYTIIALVLLIVIAILEANYGKGYMFEAAYKVQQYVTYDEEDWKNHKEIEKNKSTSSEDTNFSIAYSADDFFPIDTIQSFLPEDIKKERERIRLGDFNHLKPAIHFPKDIEAQRALIVFTEGKLLEYIKENVILKIGQCYINQKKDGNFNCVSCMVIAYDKTTKKEAIESNVYSVLKPVYDFYQSSENDIWDARDITLQIPYDYDLFNKFK